MSAKDDFLRSNCAQLNKNLCNLNYYYDATTAQTHQVEFEEAATHIAMFRCPSQLRNYHLGHKLDLPTQTYNLTTNHR